MKLTRNHLIILFVLGFAVFALSGMLDFVIGLVNGGYVMSKEPVLVAFSPVALMLTIFGFTGILLLILGAENFKAENVKLAKKQVDAGFIILLTIFGLYELLLRVPILL